MGNPLLISEIGGFNEVLLETNGAARSWSVASNGTLSAEVMTADLVRAGLMRPKGRWVRILHDDAGTWAGEISDADSRGDGTTEIAAIEWRGSLFDKRLVPRQSRPLFGPAGTLSLITIAATERMGHLWVTERTAHDAGNPVQLQLAGQQLLEALDSLRSASGQEYGIDPDTMAYRWDRIGLDKTATVQLVAPRHIVDYSAPDSLEPVVTWLKMYTESTAGQRTRSLAAVSREGIQRWGVRQAAETIDITTSASALRRAAQARVDELAAQGASLEYQIVNEDRCWGWFRQGDTICALLPEISSQLDIRIMARSLPDNEDVMSVSSIITNWTVY